MVFRAPPVIATYKIINVVTGKFYYGSSKNVASRFRTHLRTLQGGHHANIILQRSYAKRGLSNFRFVIDRVFDNNRDALNYEDAFIKEHLQELYNINPNASGGDILSSHPNRDDIRLRIKSSSKARASKMTPEERRDQWGRYGASNGMYGRTHTEESREKIRTNQTILRGAAHPSFGKSLPPEHRQILSDYAKTRTGDKNPFYGKRHSLETRTKIAEARKGSVPANAIGISIDGVPYTSSVEASRLLGIPAVTIRWRCLSARFPTYINLSSDTSKFGAPKRSGSPIKIIVDDVEYASTKAAADAVGCTAQTINRRVASAKFPGYRLA
jgi:group I intron endonuclease